MSQHDSTEYIVPSKLHDYQPTFNRKSTAEEVALLEASCGYRNCNDSPLDIFINFFLVAIVAVLLFVLLSLECTEKFLTMLVPSTHHTQRLILKATIFFIVIYLADRAIESWRKCNILCQK